MAHGALFGWLGRLLGRVGRQPVIVERIATHCPHGGNPVTLEVTVGEAGLERVLRCSARPESPCSCAQDCLRTRESAAAEQEPVAHLIYPPGTIHPEDVD